MYYVVGRDGELSWIADCTGVGVVRCGKAGVLKNYM